jgi:RHS repeat-associated protein
MLKQCGEETVKPTARLGADLDQTFSNTLFSINTQTFELTQLAGGDDYIMNGIAWAADGQRVFYMADGGIYAAKDDGSCWALVAELENMVTFAGRQNLVLSLDGNLVALMCADSLGVSKIWAANLIEGSTIDSTTVTTYTYDATNRLTSVGGMAYTWDDRGNLIHDGVFTYTYNAAGRLVRAQSLTSTLVYTYNAAGLRVAQSVDGDETTFAWDWALPLPQVLATSDGALDVYGLARIGELRDSAWSYSLGDELSSVRQRADGSGYVTYAAGHTPFGEYLWQDGSTDSAWGYTGERRDSSAGVIYLRARWYRPSEGRFSQKDPWEGNQ